LYENEIWEAREKKLKLIRKKSFFQKLIKIYKKNYIFEHFHVFFPLYSFHKRTLNALKVIMNIQKTVFLIDDDNNRDL
jgi:hypothetical protein